jgi:SAM-dependent methyltransferase
MDRETIEFYDRESSFYSQKRYPDITSNFTQYLFKARRDIFLNMLFDVLTSTPNPSMLEIGCADGILFRQIDEKYPSKAGKLVGMDVSPKMVEEAKKRNTNPDAKFYLRDELPEEKFDVVIELGVHPFDLGEELAYAHRHLKPGGYFFYSVVGSKSLYAKFKMKDKNYKEDYMPYKEYEGLFKKMFSIDKSRAYGFFIPKLWSLPIVARTLQPICDLVFQKIATELFHEKIYRLRSAAK